MKFRNFLDVGRTAQQSYYKDGVELLYPDLEHPLKIAILPAYDILRPDPVGFVPAVIAGEESDFYCAVRAAKFVGHGNRRAKVSFLSPRTFDINADDPYEAFYDYCSRSDKWSYLTKDNRGKRLTGEVEGAIFPKMKNFFVANVMDVSAGSRGGVFVTELSESVMKNILYSVRKNGGRVDGIAFSRDKDGQLVYGDITDPRSALVIEVAFGGKGYAARPAVDGNGNVMRTEIPSVLLQHRKHMEEPETFLINPGSGQEIVDRMAGMLRGYKSDFGMDEIDALKKAMKFAYGDRYHVDENAEERDDPFARAAHDTVSEEPVEKAGEVAAAVDRGVEREKYTPVGDGHPRFAPRKAKPAAGKAKKAEKAEKEAPAADPFAPGENVDMSDLAAMRAMLAGGK